MCQLFEAANDTGLVLEDYDKLKSRMYSGRFLDSLQIFAACVSARSMCFLFGLLRQKKILPSAS